MDWSSVREAVYDEFLRLRGAQSSLSTDVLNRAIAQSLAGLRPMGFWFNTADLALDTVVDQKTYLRNSYADTTATKLPWGFWRPVSDRLILDHEKQGNLNLYDIEEREPTAWDRLDRTYRTSNRPDFWTLKGERELWITPAPDSVDQIQGRYIADLGTPLPWYDRGAGAWVYRLEEPGGGYVRSVVSAMHHDDSADVYTAITNLNDPSVSAAGFPSAGTTEDALYLGFRWMPLSPLTFTLLAGSGGWTIAWEYYNGAWTALSGVTDNTGAMQTGSGTVVYTNPTDPQPLSVNNSEWLYWIRARITSGTIPDDPGDGRPYLQQVQQPDRIDPNTFSTRWFTEPAAFDVLVARAAVQYFLRHQRDNEQAQRAQNALVAALGTLKRTSGSLLTIGEIEPWMGDNAGSFEFYYAEP